jgi:hypothetical protein
VSLEASVGRVAPRSVVARILDREARSLEHRLKEPAEGDVFPADIFLDLSTRKTPLGLFYGTCKPGFNDVFGLWRIEGEDEVVEAQRASRFEYGGDPCEG